MSLTSLAFCIYSFVPYFIKNYEKVCFFLFKYVYIHIYVFCFCFSFSLLTFPPPSIFLKHVELGYRLDNYKWNFNVAELQAGSM